MDFRTALRSKRLFFEGGMGTQLQGMGLAAGTLPESWNLTHPGRVQSVHEAYLRAGCRLIKTNTFGANAHKLSPVGLSVSDVIGAAVQTAKRAVAAVGVTDAFIGLDVGPCGRLLSPFGDLPFEEAVALFAEMIDAGAKDADFILIETMSDLYEAKAAILAAKEHSDLPIVVTLSFDVNGKLLTGADVATAAIALQDLGIDALGFNCGVGPTEMLSWLASLRAVCDLPVAVAPNAGLPQWEDGKTVFPVGPTEFARASAALAADGAAVLGGCCGTTPAHLQAVVAACENLPLPTPVNRSTTAVTSYCRTAAFGGRPLLIGERLNPTGKPRLKEALRTNNIPYLLAMGVEQAENGADILDVNVGLPELDEPTVMVEVMTALQAVTDRPLQIDTTHTGAMERALRQYNGKPLLNSVNGKQESLQTVLPIVKKYGAAVVGLTLDENGIPETADGRVAIAEKIAAACDKLGIPRRNLIIDPLCLTVSTGAQNAVVTCEAIARIRRELGLSTVLGVSNVSFGLPMREELNAVFFAEAMKSGLSAGIVNPLSERLMDTYAAHLALAGEDPDLLGYIGRMGGRTPTAAAATVAPTASPLGEAIAHGLADEAYALAKARLADTPPLSLINDELIPSLDRVGKGFEKGTLFLPQLLTAATAAGRAFDAIKEFWSAKGSRSAPKARLAIATVKGDIHDIGKNIVRTLLENYGYEVLDLGRDVSPETIVQTAVEEDLSLVLLSALMTTTVPSMEETIRALRAAKPTCKVAVGGAVLTQEYADRIGADFYGEDALAAVRYADSLFDA